MIEIFLEELERICEEIEESKRYPDNFHAGMLRTGNYTHAKKIIGKIEEWLDENVREDERG